MDLKELDLLGPDPGAHWYYRSKGRILLRCVRNSAPHTCPSSILDVGAGSGFFSRLLLQHTPAQSATCVDPGYPAEYEETVHGKPLRFLRSATAANADLLLFMDVLEHVPDDAALLREYTTTMSPGARVFATVPAFQALWSGHDEFLGHHRRYTRRTLTDTLHRAGLVPDLVCYAFAPVLPIATASRWAQRLFPPRTSHSQLRRHSPPVNALLATACALELPFLPHNRIAGLTVLALAHKPSSPTAMPRAE